MSKDQPLAALLLAVVLSACGDAGGKKTITCSRVMDLSHVIDMNIPLWPGDPPVEFEPVAEFATHGYYLRRFSIGEHSATHMNASNSFVEGGRD